LLFLQLCKFVGVPVSTGNGYLIAILIVPWA
jgi:hypothetical protein